MTDKQPIYAELPQSTGEHHYGGGIYTEAQLRLYADATHALRTQAQPGYVLVRLTPDQIKIGSDVYWGKPQLRNAFEAGARFAENHHSRALVAAPKAPQQEVQEPAFWTRQRFGEEREFCEKPFTTDWTPLYTAQPAPSGDAEDAARESDYRRGYRHGYEQRDAEVRGALV